MPCESRVRIWYDDKNKPVKYKLFCEGKCNKTDDKPCHNVPEQHQGFTIEYCGCPGNEEAPGCRIRLHISDTTSVECSEKKCQEDKGDKKRECAFKRVGEGRNLPIPTKDGKYTGKLGRWIDWKCECQKEGDFEPEDPDNPKL